MKKILIILAVCGCAIAGIFQFVSRESRTPIPQSNKTGSRPLLPRIAGNRNDTLPRHISGVDHVLIEKKAHRLTLYRKGEVLKTYRIALGKKPVGKKTTNGDCKTPEGTYSIDHRKANSRYHRALHISYPNAEDRRQAKARGVSPGGDIMIHGLPNGFGAVGSLHLKRDWTLGCIAMTNEEIDELWHAVPNGAVVEIVP